MMFFDWVCLPTKKIPYFFSLFFVETFACFYVWWSLHDTSSCPFNSLPFISPSWNDITSLASPISMHFLHENIYIWVKKGEKIYFSSHQFTSIFFSFVSFALCNCNAFALESLISMVTHCKKNVFSIWRKEKSMQKYVSFLLIFFHLIFS